MYHLWVDNILFGSVDMNTQKFLIPDGIEYYTGNEALLFQNLKTSVLKIFNKYKYEFVITPVVDSINLESDFGKNREQEVVFAKQLTEKYGKGSLDISTGIFTPAE